MSSDYDLTRNERIDYLADDLRDMDRGDSQSFYGVLVTREEYVDPDAWEWNLPFANQCTPEEAACRLIDHVFGTDEESVDWDEGRRQYAAWKRATPQERAMVTNIAPCEHLDTEDFKCLQCGEWVNLPTGEKEDA